MRRRCGDAALKLAYLSTDAAAAAAAVCA